MYSRQNRNPRDDIAVELPRDYSGNAFSPFPQHREPPVQAYEVPPRDQVREEEDTDGKKDEGEESRECGSPVRDESEFREASPPPVLAGLGSLFGGNIGLEELLLLGVIFLIFTDDSLRDSELLICLLLILFI